MRWIACWTAASLVSWRTGSTGGGAGGAIGLAAVVAGRCAMIEGAVAAGAGDSATIFGGMTGVGGGVEAAGVAVTGRAGFCAAAVRCAASCAERSRMLSRTSAIAAAGLRLAS